MNFIFYQFFFFIFVFLLFNVLWLMCDAVVLLAACGVVNVKIRRYIKQDFIRNWAGQGKIMHTSDNWVRAFRTGGLHNAIRCSDVFFFFSGETKFFILQFCCCFCWTFVFSVSYDCSCSMAVRVCSQCQPNMFYTYFCCATTDHIK